MDAEVSADNMSVIIDSSTPLVAPIAHVIDDTGQALVNGRLDPGETADLTFTFGNYGAAATGVSAQLASVDPAVIIDAGYTELPDLDTGDTADNVTPFTVTVDPDAPLGGTVVLDITVNYDGGHELHGYAVLIGQYHYLVWDAEPIQSSGPVLHQVLGEVGYNGLYLNDLPSDLSKYRSLFVCVGFYADNYRFDLNAPEALAIEDFANAGGCVYLEGGDVWDYDPDTGGHNFGPLFGLTGVADGTGDMNQAVGVDGTFTQGMQIPFIASSSYVDHLAPVNGGYTVFNNSYPAYACAVARDTGTYRSLGMSFLFGGLGDFDPPSTRADLARAIMEFFLQDPLLDSPDTPALAAGVSAYPNPFNPQTNLAFTNPQSGPVSLELFDLRGQLVRTLVATDMAAGEHSVVWDGRDDRGRQLGSGVYLARLVAGSEISREKLTLVK